MPVVSGRRFVMAGLVKNPTWSVQRTDMSFEVGGRFEA
jgi:hypothetical protein